MENPITRKTWKEFRESGLLWFINSILHLFGWCITVEIKDDEIVNAYPARCKFRGFSESSNDKGYAAVTKYLKDNIDSITKDIEGM